MMTFDKKTIDAAGTFVVGELERLDQTLNLPLVGFTWSRDIKLRSDVSIADEISSYTNTHFAASGHVNPNGKNWINSESTALAGVNVDIQKTSKPLTLWGMELGWTVVELQAAQKVGRPIDTQKYDGMQLKWNMDTDEQVYIGDTHVGVSGLANMSTVTTSNAAKTWENSTNKEILDSINTLLTKAWLESAYTLVPTDLLLPPDSYALIANRLISDAGTQSLLNYLTQNTIAFHNNGVPLNIRPVKWLKNRGVSNTNRMVAYTNLEKYIRFPMVPLSSVPIQYEGLWQKVTYYGKLGAVENPYPETISYMDGI